jgi:hypothetical protein
MSLDLSLLQQIEHRSIEHTGDVFEGQASSINKMEVSLIQPLDRPGEAESKIAQEVQRYGVRVAEETDPADGTIFAKSRLATHSTVRVKFFHDIPVDIKIHKDPANR